MAQLRLRPSGSPGHQQERHRIKKGVWFMRRLKVVNTNIFLPRSSPGQTNYLPTPHHTSPDCRGTHHLEQCVSPMGSLGQPNAHISGSSRSRDTREMKRDPRRKKGMVRTRTKRRWRARASGATRGREGAREEEGGH